MTLFGDRRPFSGQDPFVVPFELGYLLIESVSERRIVIKTINNLTNFQSTGTHLVWHDPQESQVWAPELHNLDGLWYIYYAASDGYNVNHRTYVLEADHPLGPYRSLGKVADLSNDFWAIDSTILEHEGQRYLIWSGWPTEHAAFPQNLYGALLQSDSNGLVAPNRIGDRILLCEPHFNWEKSIAPILEGPQILKSDSGKLFISYSANASWTCEYAVGLLEYNGGPILDPDSWVKAHLPILRGGGHGCFIGDNYIYHRKLSRSLGWADREIVSAPFSWVDGYPVIHV